MLTAIPVENKAGPLALRPVAVQIWGDRELSTMNATFVLFVRKTQRNRVRGGLTSELLGEVTWRERKLLSGSEFYFSGPSADARLAHAAAARLVTADPFGA
jgi:hypothetical protein